ncbi:MAG: hydantoinase/oxoprolinase family protein [Candidatus Binatia bacterium]
MSISHHSHGERQRRRNASAIVGVDTGGTFTDLIAFLGTEMRTLKVLSTPSDPTVAVFRGLDELLPGMELALLTYGSTVATNALLQRTGARVVLLTTAGFEDVIEIGRQNRPALYDLEPRPPQPLVPRAQRIGVRERTLADGRILVPLRRTALRQALLAARRHHPEAVAVCFLHSYANPQHESLVGAALGEWPDVFCSLSHALSAEHREYERLSTAVINAYVGPIMSRHLRALERGLGGVRPRVMQSNGGAISAQLAGREAVRTVLSGPAAGVAGAWSVARSLGLQRVITFDMGGTSTDVSLIDGEPCHRSEWTIAGVPLQVPAIDIHTVGAGGGSIARRDAGGALKVGPESAGADPGPACYGAGQLPTVTDANVLLGRLLPEAFLGGRMRLQPERSARVIERLGKGLRLACEQAAEGIIRVVNASMERAIRSISVERGHEPRDYTLIAFGGAAGQHACELSAALGIRRVVVPRDPGLLSARGAASADVQRDYVRTVRLTGPSADRLHALFAPLERAARSDLRAEGILPKHWKLARSVDVRYQGQSYEIGLPLNTRFADAFHATHRRLYGYADRSRPIEVVNLRLLALGRGPRLRQRPVRVEAGVPPTKSRLRWAGRWLTSAVYARTRLPAGASLAGPVIITEFSATTIVPPGWRCRVHPTGHLEFTHAR